MPIIKLPVNGEIKEVDTETIESRLSGLLQIGEALHTFTDKLSSDVCSSISALRSGFGRTALQKEHILSVGVARLHNFFPRVEEVDREYGIIRGKETSLSALKLLAGATHKKAVEATKIAKSITDENSIISTFAARQVLVGAGFFDPRHTSIGVARQAAMVLATPDEMFPLLAEEDQDFAVAVLHEIEPYENTIMQNGLMLAMDYPSRNYAERLQSFTTT
jgi:hypothetical protein